MSWLLGLLVNNPLVRGLGTVLAALAGFWAYGKVKKREGRKDALREAKEKDNENAADIRRRAADADGVSDDDIRFRD